MIKNLNWQKKTSWPFTKRSKPEDRTGLEPEVTACKPNNQTTGPRLKPHFLRLKLHYITLLNV